MSCFLLSTANAVLGSESAVEQLLSLQIMQIDTNNFAEHTNELTSHLEAMCWRLEDLYRCVRGAVWLPAEILAESFGN